MEDSEINMIDTRLTSNNDYLEYFEKRLQIAKMQAFGVPNYAQLIDILQEWWQIALRMAINSAEEKSNHSEIADWLCTNLPAENRPSVFIRSVATDLTMELLYALDNFHIKPEQINETTWDTAWFILGSAIGKNLACNDANMAHMTIGWSFTERQDVGRAALSNAWVESLRTNLEQRDACFYEIENMVKELTIDLSRCYFERDRPIVQSCFAEWEKVVDLSEVWREPHIFSPFYCNEIGILDLIRKIDKIRYLKILDLFTSPVAVREALSFPDIAQDREEILILLNNAQNIIDPAGKWNRRTAALLLIEVVISYAQSLVEVLEREIILGRTTDVNFKHLKEQEIPDWFKSAFAALIGRNDGKIIAVEWLIELINRYHTEVWRHGESEWSVLSTAIDSLAQCLSDKELNLSYVSELFGLPETPNITCAELQSDTTKTRPPLFPTNRDGLSIILGTSIIEEEEPSNGSNEVLWCWFQELLLERNKGIEKHFSSGDLLRPRWIYSQIGKILSSFDNPKERWLQAWQVMQNQRRRGMHQSYCDDRNALAPSQFLLQTGILTLDWLVSEEFNKCPLAQDLWETIYDSLREAKLTQPMDIHDSFPRLISYLFARWPQVYRDMNPLESLLPDLKPLWGDNELICSVAVNLNCNGLSPKTLKTCFQKVEIDLIKSIKTDIFWRQLTKEASYVPSPEVSGPLSHLAED